MKQALPICFFRGRHVNQKLLTVRNVVDIGKQKLSTSHSQQHSPLADSQFMRAFNDQGVLLSSMISVIRLCTLALLTLVAPKSSLLLSREKPWRCLCPCVAW